MAIDQNLCQQYIDKSKAIMAEVETFLPWVGPGGGEPTSTVAMAAYLKMQNVEPPKSTQEGDSELLLWKARNPQYAPMLEAMTRLEKSQQSEADIHLYDLTSSTRPSSFHPIKILRCATYWSMEWCGWIKLSRHS